MWLDLINLPNMDKLTNDELHYLPNMNKTMLGIVLYICRISIQGFRLTHSLTQSPSQSMCTMLPLFLSLQISQQMVCISSLIQFFFCLPLVFMYIPFFSGSFLKNKCTFFVFSIAKPKLERMTERNGHIHSVTLQNFQNLVYVCI